MPRTTRTPEGNYPATRAVHHLDLEAASNRLREELPGTNRRTESLARESGVSIIMMAMEAGDALKEHSANGVVAVQVMHGHATLETEEGKVELYPGEMALFQPNVRHNVRAEEQSTVLLTVTGGDE